MFFYSTKSKPSSQIEEALSACLDVSINVAPSRGGWRWKGEVAGPLKSKAPNSEWVVAFEVSES